MNGPAQPPMRRATTTLVRAAAGIGEACYVAVLAVATPYAALRLGETWGADAPAWDDNAHPMEVSAAAHLILMAFGASVFVLLGVYVALRAWRRRTTALILFTGGGAIGAVAVGASLALAL